LIVLSLPICAPNLCSAHQKWLWPNRFAAEKAPVWISFDVTWSDVAFAAEKGVGEQPLSVVGPTGRRQSPARVFVGNTKSTAEAELTEEGTYRLEAVDPLSYWTRIEKDGSERWLKKPKNEVTEAKITRADYYWAKAVAYVSVGKQSELPASNAADPLDIELETHPSQIAARRPIITRVISFGKPLSNAEIKVFSANATGHDPLEIVKCDADGRAEMQLATPGKCLLACEIERNVADDPHADIHSFHFYLTLLVQSPDR
jgi:hypothetical protein